MTSSSNHLVVEASPVVVNNRRNHLDTQQRQEQHRQLRHLSTSSSSLASTATNKSLSSSLSKEEASNSTSPLLSPKNTTTSIITSINLSENSTSKDDDKVYDDEKKEDAVNAFLGIPGTKQTYNGYDAAMGADAICWEGRSAPPAEEEDKNKGHNNAKGKGMLRTEFPNPLVENFTLLGEVQLKQECPFGNNVTVQPPEPFLRGERLRTTIWYDYNVTITLNLSSLPGKTIISDSLGSMGAMQVVVCAASNSGFCSPFVHEQASTRDAILGIKNKTQRGYLHGGTHIHSPWQFFPIDKDKPYYQHTQQVPLLVNVPGEYYVIAAVQFYTGSVYNITTKEKVYPTKEYYEADEKDDSNKQQIKRTITHTTKTTTVTKIVSKWDMANAMDPAGGSARIIRYQEPAIILHVSKSVQILSYVVIFMSSMILFFLLFHTVRNRDHHVLRLSQGHFLIVFLLCAITATVSSCLMEPKNDIYCQLRGPMIFIPLQLLYSITFGRLWRINAVISPLLVERLHEKEKTTNMLLIAVEKIRSVVIQLTTRENRRSSSSVGSQRSRDSIRGSTRNLRKAVTNRQLATCVFIFTIPQIIVQVFAFIYQPQEYSIYYNNDESIGRSICTITMNDKRPVGQSLYLYATILLLTLVFLLLVMAYASRSLPSLFNETKVIFSSTFLSFILMLLGFGIILVTNEPTTSPDVEYIVWIFVLLSMTLNVSIQIMMPKLRMVWNNETVIVSKLVSDYNQQENSHSRTTSMYGGDRSGYSSYYNENTMRGVTGLDFTDTTCSEIGHTNNNNAAYRQKVLSCMSSLSGIEEDSYAGSTVVDHDQIVPLTTRAPTIDENTTLRTNNVANNTTGINNNNNIPISADEQQQQQQKIVEDIENPPSENTSKTEEVSSTTSDDVVILNTDNNDEQQTPGEETPQEGYDHSKEKTNNNDNGAAPHVKSRKSVSFDLHRKGELTETIQEEEPAPELLASLVSHSSGANFDFDINEEEEDANDNNNNNDDNNNKNVHRNYSSERSSEQLSSQLSSEQLSSSLLLLEQQQQQQQQIQQKRRRTRPKLLIKPDETPARKLVLRMVDLQDQLDEINKRIMSGLVVQPDDWYAVRKGIHKLDHTFCHDIEFDWEVNRQKKEDELTALDNDDKSIELTTTGTNNREHDNNNDDENATNSNRSGSHHHSFPTNFHNSFAVGNKFWNTLRNNVRKGGIGDNQHPSSGELG